ncbi:MAG: hydantoinase B/oxoprolinase family protein [Thaumarchaeota archaeon]|nr:hydantoinase B/oxoprolinase family protein [Nitrososphaerota archaeon]
MDPVTVQIIRSSLLYASEEMGIALRNASYSPNIKERMDHSAAIFDADGRLIAQAEHMPVHLGSLPWGLNNIIRYCSKEGMEFERGSMVVVNNPYIAGTHLNDITVVSPIYRLDGAELLGFAANKAHHADVGGSVPGSISIDSRSVLQEGFLINPVYLMRNGDFIKDTVSIISSNSRTPKERIGDLKAQVAANVTGVRRVAAIVSKYGFEIFKEAAEESFEYSEAMMRSRLSTIKRGVYSSEDFLEHPDGTNINLKVKLEISDEGVEVDYTGTHRQVDFPLNAVFGVTLSGVYFVIRTLTGDDIPANHGAFAAINVRAPEGSLLNPTFPHPVGGGNVETSQRNADVLFRAFSKAIPDRCPAAPGGSMNNVMIGGIHKGSSWAFYETIAVGLGGKKGMDGLDGIQSNMTNTMNTPIEDIERSMPMMVTRYEFRENTSGRGEFRGGCGVVRAFKMLSDSVTFTILSDRERIKPWGLLGGGDGMNTKVVLITNNTARQVRNKGTYILNKDDEFQIHTAGGGGYGRASRRDKEKLAKDIENGLVSRDHKR